MAIEPPRDRIRIQSHFGFRSDSRLSLSARALRGGLPNFTPNSRRGALRTMWSQFASREVPGVSVTLEIRAPGHPLARHKAVSDAEGFVHFDIPLGKGWALPDHTVWEEVGLRWRIARSPYPDTTTARILAPGTQAPFAVISDIDDTIIETGITGAFRSIARNWRRVVLQMPSERLMVRGADRFYRLLTAGDEEGSRRPIFYVSSSPWNLFAYLVAYKKERRLPLGPIELRDWGFNRRTLGGSSHGAHKRRAIERILATYPTTPFVLVGDDTQGDLTAFGDIAVRHPGRIKGIFIRRAGESFSPAELDAQEAIEALEIPLALEADFDTADTFLKTIGLQPDQAG